MRVASEQIAFITDAAFIVIFRVTRFTVAYGTGCITCMHKMYLHRKFSVFNNPFRSLDFVVKI